MIVVAYCIVSAGSLSDLEELVNKLIRNGWEPQGGLVCENQGFRQAMVRREEPAGTRY